MLSPEKVDFSSDKLWPLGSTIRLYAVFFPLQDDLTGEVLRPRDITDFDVNVVSTEDYDNYNSDTRTILGHILSNPTVMTQDHKNAIVERMFEGIAGRLGAEDPAVALRMLTYFSYDVQSEFFLNRVEGK